MISRRVNPTSYYLQFHFFFLQISLLVVSLVATAGGVASVLQSSSLGFQLLTLIPVQTWHNVITVILLLSVVSSGTRLTYRSSSEACWTPWWRWWPAFHQWGQCCDCLGWTGSGCDVDMEQDPQPCSALALPPLGFSLLSTDCRHTQLQATADLQQSLKCSRLGQLHLSRKTYWRPVQSCTNKFVLSLHNTHLSIYFNLQYNKLNVCI